LSCETKYNLISYFEKNTIAFAPGGIYGFFSGTLGASS